MNIILLVPKVVNRYVASFPEVTNNAYKYFNYDRPVIEERVFRGDAPSAYRGPDDLQDVDYDSLVRYAKSIMDPVLVKYNAGVACEDALSKALRSFGNGMFDNKVNSSRYAALLCAMRQQLGLPASRVVDYRHSDEQIKQIVMAAKKAPAKKGPPAPKRYKPKTRFIKELAEGLGEKPSELFGRGKGKGKGTRLVTDKGTKLFKYTK